MTRVQKVLIFTQTTANSGMRPATNTDLEPLAEQANKAVQDLGEGWSLVSASTTVEHYMHGNLNEYDHVLTVIAEKS